MLLVGHCAGSAHQATQKGQKDRPRLEPRTEKPLPPEDEPEGILDAYLQMLRMLALRPVQLLFLMLFTWKVPFAICESVAPVKFQEYGIPKESWAHSR